MIRNGTDKDRYVFIDGLRGIAAMMVVFDHLVLCTVMSPALGLILPGVVGLSCAYGRHGVQIFFVISGFVIAHSLRHIEPTGRAIGNFILRRQLRLDPPYWFALVMVLIIAAVESRIPSLAARETYGPRTILVNMAYLQYATQATQMLAVAWTLCLEIQFYLVFILILGATRLVSGEVTRAKTPLVATLLVFGLGLVSLAFSTNQEVDQRFFLGFWSYFACGVLCYWALRGRLHSSVFWAFIGANIAAMVWHHHNPAHAQVVFDSELTCVLISSTLFLVGNAGHLTDWLGDPVLGYLGRISYSLYLVHFPILTLVMQVGYKVTGKNPWAGLAWLLVALACSIAGGHIVHTLIEGPSMRLASKLKPGRNTPALTGDLEPAGLAAAGAAPL
jgi:peptidoglycan/LPS O-acetylase OafA/YrhL